MIFWVFGMNTKALIGDRNEFAENDSGSILGYLICYLS